MKLYEINQEYENAIQEAHNYCEDNEDGVLSWLRIKIYK